jgi:hypothetical protein
MAKRAREQAVKEKRERKLERKQAAAAAKLAGDVEPVEGAEGEDIDGEDVDGEDSEVEGSSELGIVTDEPAAVESA